MSDGNDKEALGLPQSIEAEQALLGAILASNDLYHEVTQITAEHFYEPLHARIFEYIGKLLAKGRTANAFSLDTFLMADPVYNEIGGKAYLAGLTAASVSTAFSVRSNCEVIHECAVYRGMIGVAHDLDAAARDPDPDYPPDKLLEDAGEALYSLASKGTHGRAKTLAEALQGCLEQTEKAYQADGGVIGIETSLKDLDRLIGGFQGGQLIVLGARPAMGKSALAGQFAFRAAAGPERKRVMLFSLEMDAEQFAGRMLASQTEIPAHKIRRGEIIREQFEDLVTATTALQSAPLHIDDTGGLSLGQITARARRQARTTGLDLIIIDYLQLIPISRRAENKVQGLTEITVTLKALARELGVPIVLLSQLNRGVESREDKRPMLADLRESGSIEQDADIVMFLFREEYYLDQKETPEDPIKAMAFEERKERLRGIAELNVAKNRHGPTGLIKLKVRLATMTFKGLDDGMMI